MKIKHNNSRMAVRIATLVLGLGLAGFGITSVISQVSAASYEKAQFRKVTPGSMNEYRYLEDSFEAEYSKGVAFLAPKSVKTHGGISCSKYAQNDTIKKGNYFCGNNTTKNSGIYVEFGKAAYSLDYGWLDVIEYDWIPNGAIYALNLGNTGMASDEGTKAKNTKTNIHREIHFYKSGTTEEVTFKGIIAFADFDWGEGYSITTGLRRGYVITRDNTTPLIHSNANTWVMSGTGSGSNYENDLHAMYDNKYVLWTEVEGSQAKPLKLVMTMPKLRRGAKNNTPYTYVYYQMGGSTPASLSYRKSDIIATYGKLSVSNTPIYSDTANFSFDGWKVNGQSPNGITVGQNGITLYGSFTKNSTEQAERSTSVTTSITNGQISPSASNVSADDDYTVGFFCNNGYTIGSVLVNGAQQDGITGNSGDYTFGFASMSSEEIAEQNSIAVSCVEGPGADQDDEYEDDDSGLPSIITSIENGTITESITDIDAEETYDVEYSCNEGFHLASILVNGEEVSITDHPTSYTFEGVSEKRTIDVVCTDVNTPNTGAIGSSNFGSDSTTGGSINVVAIVVSSLISIAGIALVFRFVKYSHAISFKK